MLVHHSNSCIHGFTRACEGDFLAIKENATFVWLIQPIEKVHECGLAGTIFAKQGMNLPRLNDQGNVVVCDNRTKLLGHALQLKLHRFPSPTRVHSHPKGKG